MILDSEKGFCGLESQYEGETIRRLLLLRVQRYDAERSECCQFLNNPDTESHAAIVEHSVRLSACITIMPVVYHINYEL